MDLVTQAHWDTKYETGSVVPETLHESLVECIMAVSALKQEGRCIEIGVFPGGYINLFGKLGYEISGMDLTPRVAELNDIFRFRNYAAGKFWQQDFFEYKPQKKYDIVYSIGFIEHFIDYKTVIARHCDLVTDGGILFISAPNFRGKLQYALHRIIDSKNLRRHNLESMNPQEWADVLTENNFEIIEQGYKGSFYFWAGIKTRYVRHAVRLLFNHIINPLLGRILSKPSPAYSPFCVIIARKKK